MLKKRLVAVLILRNGQVVQSLQFKHTNIIHNKASVAVDFFDRWSVDEIVVLDVSPTQDARAVFFNAVEELAAKCFVPLTVGGWVESIDDIKTLLSLGADKVSLNTAIHKQPELITEASEIFGSQCIVASIDVRKDDAGNHVVWTDRGRHNTEVEVVEWTSKAVSLGAGEIFLTSIDHDGARKGYDLELMNKVATSVAVPVIAFGGVSEWGHFVEGIIDGGVEAVSAANCFHYTEHSTKKAKEYMKKSGVDVR